MTFEIFLMAAPGLEPFVADEARAAGFADPVVVPGGVVTQGGWPEVWRANLVLRGPGRVLARIGAFRAFHLAQLDKRARKFPWGDVLRPDVPVRVEVATNRKSKIYHAGAAQQRIETALAEELGVPIADAEVEGAVTVRARIDDNLVVLSVDTSGDGLHKRGHKEAVGRAPLRETMAAMFLRACGYDGHEPVLDPMCGSGTFVIEAAEIAAGLLPGRSRSFGFERLATFEAQAWQALRTACIAGAHVPAAPGTQFYGSDRDAGAFTAARANAERAGVAEMVSFAKSAVGEIVPPEGPPGLVIVNPPYGQRIGQKKSLYGLHGALGGALKARFRGWRVGIVTTEAALAQATGLPLLSPGPPVAHGGLRVRLHRTEPLS